MAPATLAPRARHIGDRDSLNMPPIPARASAWLTIAAIFCCACGGETRRDSVEPLQVRIGVFGANQAGRPSAAQLADLLSAEPLVSVAWDGRPTLRLAEAAEDAADGLGITITLRSRMKFHNGEAVTAAAVRDLLLPKFPRQGVHEITDIRVLDGRTLHIAIREPYAFKTIDLSEFIVDDDAQPHLRTGPFRIVSSRRPVVLEPHDEYYLGTPRIRRVEILEYPSQRAAWTAMMRGEVNFLHEVNRETIEFLEGSHIRTYPLLRPYYVPLAFNLRHPILQRQEVRVALNRAIDREEVVARGMAGRGRISEGPIWPHHWAYKQGRYAPPHDPEIARSLLDAAGLPAQRREGGMPSRFRFTCLILEGDARFEQIALVVQRQLFSVGIDMQLLPLSPRELVERIRAGNYEAFLFELVTGRTLRLPYRFWHSQSGFVSTGYASADAALDRMRLARTDDETRTAVAEVMEVMQADPPAIFLAMPREVRAADASLDIPYETDRDVFGSLWQATRAPAGE